jgi:hypothetical protein
VFIDVDSVQRRVYGGTKQGAAFGHAKIASKSLLVRGLNLLAATISTPLAAPVVAAARLRGGNAGSARGAATLVVEAITTARHAGATGLIVVRADSAYYSGAFVAACRRTGARFSVISPPTGITRCSPTARSRWYRPSPTTAATRSSSRSSRT